jgi:hypothetical protein
VFIQRFTRFESDVYDLGMFRVMQLTGLDLVGIGCDISRFRLDDFHDLFLSNQSSPDNLSGKQAFNGSDFIGFSCSRY